jgi:Zn-dependent peptidase ImmA (M78 family)/transcriptional regulator with XRE-family HTH domain
MANLPEISVKPELLRWARESTGVKVEKVAHTLGITRAEVERWEDSPSSIRLTQLEKLSEIYKRPLAAFFLPVPPKEPPLPKDFRRLPDSESLSPASRLAIRRARRLRTVALELSETLNTRPTTRIQKITDTTDPEAVALEMRRALGVSIEEQLGWNDSRDAFAGWRVAIERMGALAFQLPMPVKEIRGFSISEKLFPVVVVSSKDSVNGRIFSLLHEFAHILLNVGGLCDMREDAVLASGIQIEHFCNWFAGAVLVPREDLLRYPLVQKARDERTLDDELLPKLANTFRVSQDVVLRRLLMTHVITEDIYKQKSQQLEEAFKNLPKKKSKGGAPPAAKAVQENGVLFTSMVLAAYRSEGISSKEVSDYLGLRQKHLGKVEKLLTTKAKLYG